MDIERLRQAVIDKRFILSANPDWRAGRSCGLTDDKTEQKANDALTIILENIEELVVAYLIDSRQLVKSEEVQEAIDILQAIRPSEKEIKSGEYPEVADAIDLAITALQAYQPWVSVEDRLPDGDVASVLIYTNKGGVSEGQYYPSIKSWKQFRWSVENADVTHWKPLPEPPKPEMTDEEKKILREFAAWFPDAKRLFINWNDINYADEYFMHLPFGRDIDKSKAYEVLAPILEKYGEINLNDYRDTEAEKEEDEPPFGSYDFCGYEFNSELINEYEISHCPKCGEEIEESIDLGW